MNYLSEGNPVEDDCMIRNRKRGRALQKTRKLGPVALTTFGSLRITRRNRAGTDAAICKVNAMSAVGGQQSSTTTLQGLSCRPSTSCRQCAHNFHLLHETLPAQLCPDISYPLKFRQNTDVHCPFFTRQSSHQPVPIHCMAIRSKTRLPPHRIQTGA